MSRPWLSVVIPAYNEAERLPGALDRLLAYLRSRGKDFEVVVRGFAFDVEFLLLARLLGHRAVAWGHVPESRVHPIKDSARMLLDVVLVRLRFTGP